MQYRDLTLENTQRLNADLYTRFTELAGNERIRQTHFFGGRFENSYLDVSDIPEMATLVEIVRQQAGQYLGVGSDSLKAGFWFNAMQPGHCTKPHHHDENDELLSAVYYIHAPKHSGDLVLQDDGSEVIIRPEAGKLVMFAPSVMHEVTVNHSQEMRLSVAFNLGPVDNQE